MAGKRRSSFRSFAEYFWAKVDKSADCWRWTGAIGGTGYGSVNLGGGKWKKSHRLAWELTYGEIPAGNGHHGTVVAHRCDNRWCVNPDHLFLCSQVENVRDMHAKHRESRGEKHGNNLTEQDVLRIRESVLWRAKHADVAASFGVAASLIGLIARGERWNHIGGARVSGGRLIGAHSGT